MLLQLIQQFWQLLPRRRKHQAILLLLLAFLSSLSEIVSLGSLVPFVSLFLSPDKTQSYWERLVAYLPFIRAWDPLTVFTTLFIAAIAGANGLRSLFTWASAKIAYNTMRDFSIQVYSSALRKSYHEHTMKNSSEVVDQILFKITNGIGTTVLPVFMAVGQSLLALGIIGALLWYRPLLTVVLGGFIGGAYFVIYTVTHAKILQASREFNELAKAKSKTLSESLGGIRDIIIDQNHHLFEQEFARLETRIRNIEGQLSGVGLTPRYLIEFLGMSFLVLYAFLSLKGFSGLGADSTQVVMNLGVLALGAQRLLPIGQQLYYALTQLKGKSALLAELIEIIQQSQRNHSQTDLPQSQSMNQRDQSSSVTKNIEGSLKSPCPHDLNQQNTLATEKLSPQSLSARNAELLKLDHVGFRYHAQAPWVFRHQSLTLQAGRKIAICGPTGAGKSTLIDLMMGLLDPSEGQVCIQGQSLAHTPGLRATWFSRLAHVPQSIFLLDESIESNIVFGRSKPADHEERIREVCRVAMLDEMLERLPQGLDTLVGERGIRLSGGQRQRIGIARALYKKADVIVLDEATSNLDESTEANLLHRLFEWAQGATIIFVTHRPSVLKYCDQVIHLEKGVGIKSADHGGLTQETGPES
jgi:ABC-type multidrug transport system fused ATPase/permease subunit